MTRSTRITLMTATLPLCLLADAAFAVPTAMLDSNQFAYKYEMNVQPGSQDLDGNAASDWFATASGGLIQPNVSGGFATSNQAASPQQILWRTDFTDSLSRATVNGVFTIEVSLKLDGDATPSNVGGFGFALQQPGQNNSLRFNVDNDNVSFNGAGVNAIATGSNSDDYHTYRIAYEGANSYWIWRDGELLNSSIATPFIGGNGLINGNTLGAWFLGDFTGTIDGNWSVDYIRVTPGAFAPHIPEPATFALLALATPMLARRRRTA